MQSQLLEVRLGGTLKFDPVREGHIVKKIEELNSSKKLSMYLIILIRLAFETPELIAKNDKLIEAMARLGASPCAKQFYDEGRLQIADMQRKVDAIYNMCLQMHTMYQFGKHIGMEERVNQMGRAEFILERQLSKLCGDLGIRELGVFDSNKINPIEDKAADALEYIINSYDNIVNEIKAEIQSKPQVVYTGYPMNNQMPTQVDTKTSVNKLEFNSIPVTDMDEEGEDLMAGFTSTPHIEPEPEEPKNHMDKLNAAFQSGKKSFTIDPNADKPTKEDEDLLSALLGEGGDFDDDDF